MEHGDLALGRLREMTINIGCISVAYITAPILELFQI